MLKTGPEITKINESSRERKNNSEIKKSRIWVRRGHLKREISSHIIIIKLYTPNNEMKI